MVITWMARKSSVEWPEKAYCEEGVDDVFKCSYFNHLATRPLKRTVKNDAQVCFSFYYH